MTIIVAEKNVVAESAAGVVVIVRYGIALGSEGVKLDKLTRGVVAKACAAPRYKGDVAETVDILAPPSVAANRIIVLGLGEEKSLTSLTATKAGAKLAEVLEKESETEATLLFDAPQGISVAPAEILSRIIFGLRLRHYRFQLMPRSDKHHDIHLTISASNTDAKALTRVDAVAEGVILARTLINFPASHLNPDNFADHLAPLKDVGIKIEVLESADLKKLGMNAVLAVGNGSARLPRVIVLTYRGHGAPDQPVALVGKGICFDAGGLVIKTGPQMFGMKADMSGAAAVIGTMLALAKQKAPVHIAGVLGVAENMLSGTSYKPGDIITTMSGRTVEVYDTDCEGRMVLADILHYTATRFKPSAMVDLATLTYSIMRGLGHVFAGLFTTHDDLADGLLAAGEKVGERFWRMPLDPAYDEDLRSPVADLRQHAKNLEEGDAPFAAAFLRHFAEGTPWVHLDIAGKELIDEDRPLHRAGGTGFGVQLLEEWIHGSIKA